MLRTALEDTELIEFPAFVVLTDEELSQNAGAYAVVEKKDLGMAPQRPKEGQEQRGGEEEGERAVVHAENARSASMLSMPADSAAAGEHHEGGQDEEEGFSFATLVDY